VRKLHIPEGKKVKEGKKAGKMVQNKGEKQGAVGGATNTLTGGMMICK